MLFRSVFWFTDYLYVFISSSLWHFLINTTTKPLFPFPGTSQKNLNLYFHFFLKTYFPPHIFIVDTLHDLLSISHEESLCSVAAQCNCRVQRGWRMRRQDRLMTRVTNNKPQFKKTVAPITNQLTKYLKEVWDSIFELAPVSHSSNTCSQYSQGVLKHWLLWRYFPLRRGTGQSPYH